MLLPFWVCLFPRPPNWELSSWFSYKDANKQAPSKHNPPNFPAEYDVCSAALQSIRARQGDDPPTPRGTPFARAGVGDGAVAAPFGAASGERSAQRGRAPGAGDGGDVADRVGGEQKGAQGEAAGAKRQASSCF